MEVLVTTDSHWLEKWDNFVETEDKASHLMLSDWNQSFESYGFSYEICLLLHNGEIKGGYAAALAKAAIFKFYIVPYGPIVSAGFENQLESLVNKVLERSKQTKSCYCHVTFPVSGVANRHVYSELPKMDVLESALPAHKFRYVYSSNGINWVSLLGFENHEQIVEGFRPSVRRYIRRAMRNDLDLRELVTEEGLKEAYGLCLANAAQYGYSLRSWEEFKPTLLRLVSSGRAKFLGAYKDGVIKGSGLIVKAGNYWTYILGGTVREKPDMLGGHFVHWSAIRIAFDQKLDGYNISLGGSKSVIEFKNSYATHQAVFENSKYHWVLRPAAFRMYLFMEKRLKPYKKQISRILSAIKGKG